MENGILNRAIRLIRSLVPYNSKAFRGLYYIYIRITSIPRLKKKNAANLDVQIHASDHCNLSCKSCNAFCPIIDKNFADVEKFKQDLQRLSQLTNGVLGSLSISGGEPLLHPQLPEMLGYAREYFPGQKIKIITNGIMLEKAGVDFWDACDKKNITISLTRYPIKLNINKIKETAMSHRVNLIYQDDTDVREKTMYFTPLDLKGKQNIKDSYMLCFMSNNCFVLEDGKLYTCPTIAHIGYFNKFFNQNLIVSEHDYKDIYEAKNIDEILNFMCKPMPFCRYCNKKDRVSGISWEKSKKEISEWV